MEPHIPCMDQPCPVDGTHSVLSITLHRLAIPFRKNVRALRRGARQDCRWTLRQSGLLKASGVPLLVEPADSRGYCYRRASAAPDHPGMPEPVPQRMFAGSFGHAWTPLSSPSHGTRHQASALRRRGCNGADRPTSGVCDPGSPILQEPTDRPSCACQVAMAASRGGELAGR
jgi:hypothetical protein